MQNEIYTFIATIVKEPDSGGAYMEVPLDIKALFGKARVKVHVTYDGVPYDGLVLKMGTPGYIIGIPKRIREQISKSFGDSVAVALQPRIER